MNTLQRLLSIWIGCAVGVALGRFLYVAWQVHAHPARYAAYSAPWWVDPALYALLCLGSALLAALAKWVLHRLARKRQR